MINSDLLPKIKAIANYLGDGWVLNLNLTNNHGSSFILTNGYKKQIYIRANNREKKYSCSLYLSSSTRKEKYDFFDSINFDLINRKAISIANDIKNRLLTEKANEKLEQNITKLNEYIQGKEKDQLIFNCLSKIGEVKPFYNYQYECSHYMQLKQGQLFFNKKYGGVYSISVEGDPDFLIRLAGFINKSN